MNRLTRQYLTADGVPACGNGCRYPRGSCPVHGRPVAYGGVPGAGSGLASWLPSDADRVCAECHYHEHAPDCPTLKRAQHPLGRVSFDMVGKLLERGFLSGSEALELLNGGAPEPAEHLEDESDDGLDDLPF